jgi:hypothetical protein
MRDCPTGLAPPDPEAATAGPAVAVTAAVVVVVTAGPAVVAGTADLVVAAERKTRRGVRNSVIPAKAGIHEQQKA